MIKRKFNLVNDPWIKVIDFEGKEQLVSLRDVFKNAQNYRQLAGEMKSQDLSVLRLLLAILTTVYTRFDPDGHPYKWLKLNDQWQIDHLNEEDYESDDLVSTWSVLFKKGSFTRIVDDYLIKYASCFDFFGENPFYQVNKQTYNSLVPLKKKIDLKKQTGTVALKQINRTISESGNSIAVFTPKTDSYKDEADLAEIIRWLITYQNYTGVTDKTKVKSSQKFSVSSGWLYGLNPVFAHGDNLFEELLLNLVLFTDRDEYHAQKPIWEAADAKSYIQNRLKSAIPDNIAELYTMWSRAIYVDWSNASPIIFSAGLPKVDNQNAFVEPMTTWKIDSKTKNFKPAAKWLGSLSKAMWRNFGDYVQINAMDADDHEPGIVSWLKSLKFAGVLPAGQLINLTTVGLISDGNATSQSPVAESFDNMKISAGVLFDQEENRRLYWPARIEQTIALTQKIGSAYWRFAKNIGTLRELSDPGEFANRLSQGFYERLNYPFLLWLASLTNDEERDPKINAWKEQIRRLAMRAGKSLLSQASPVDIVGRKTSDNSRISNIFAFFNLYKFTILKILKNS